MTQIKVVEHFELCGFVYFDEQKNSGRLFWLCEAVGSGMHSLGFWPSWGRPSDAALEEIKAAVIAHVRAPRPAPSTVQELEVLEVKRAHSE